jgi:hypothetical protein
MSADYRRFWGAIAVVAETFRADDPNILGNVRGLSQHLESLPLEQQRVIRSDLELLMVHFTKLPLYLSVPGHHEHHQ